MIYSTLDQAKQELKWLTHECSLPHFASSRLTSYEYLLLEQKLSGCDDKSIIPFFEKLFEAFKLKKPIWSEDLSHESLPVLALIPDGGMRIIIEHEADGSWKSDGVDGLGHDRDFPEKTRFTSIKSERSDTGKISATQMFKEVAKRQKPIIIHAAIASLSINILALGTSFYSMQVYDRVIPTQGVSTLIALSVGVFIAILLEMILKLSRSTILDHAAKNMDVAYSHDIFNRFLKIRSDALPKSIGTLSGQLQSYSTVRAFISSAALYLIIDFPFSMIFLAVIVMLAGWSMGFIALAFLAASIITGTIFRKKIEKLSQTSSMASHKKLGLLVETVENAENVKATGAGWSILSRWNALTEDAIHDDIVIRHYSEMSSYMSAFLQQISYVALVAMGAYLVSSTDTLTMGGLIATTILSGRVLSPIAMLPNLLVQWGRTKIAVKDLDNVYSLDGDNEGIARPLSPVILEPRFRCQNVLFAYGKDMAAIRIANLSINQGERIAILGAIGSGKSTLLKILSGLYMPQEGSVQINGIDIQHISRNRLNETIGYLPQNTKLLSGTLRDNLLLGLVGISDEQIMEAAQKTGLFQLINTLPQGLDTPVPEGGDSVSGGQKQMIAITRTILASPKVWLLDEPTASMDEGTERHILGVLHQQITSDKTLILVTHKPALLGLVNRIIVMTPQGIVMDGPRDTILQQLSNANKPTSQAKS
jgi:ATP-binding cassette subfamily C protein LapB